MGVDLGDQWSNYCILGLGGETLGEGQFRTRQQEVGEFFQGLAISRVVFEVGTHSAWHREVISGLGHEVLVANARRMEGSKRRRRKNDRIDAAKLARLGREIQNRCIRLSIGARSTGGPAGNSRTPFSSGVADQVNQRRTRPGKDDGSEAAGIVPA